MRRRFCPQMTHLKDIALLKEVRQFRMCYGYSRFIDYQETVFLGTKSAASKGCAHKNSEISFQPSF